MKKPPRLEEFSSVIFQVKFLVVFIVVEILGLVGFLDVIYRLVKWEIGF